MDPRLRTLLVGLAASALAGWVGVALAQEQHFLATVSAGLSVWAVLSWTRGPLAEAWLLGFLVFGYVIGSRGFAQFMPVPGLPLFCGELGLAAVTALALLRGAMRRALPWQPDWINGLLLLWLVVGAGRVGWDVRIFGFVALRDFAMVYYALYCFATQAIARHEPSRRMFGLVLHVTFGLLPVTGVLAVAFPDFFLRNFLVNGVPLIYYKGDLLATFLFAGFIYLVPKASFNWVRDWWRLLLALASLAQGVSLLSRAGMLGLGVGLGCLALGRRWLPTRILATAGAAGLLAVVIVSLAQRTDFTQTKAYGLYEHLVSIVDFEGRGGYRNEESVDSGDNNRFRLVWWKTLTEETLTQSPVFGLGFGYDLAKGFLLAYNPLMADDFTARSPHSIVFSTLGRMGLLGLAILAAFLVAIAAEVWAVAHRTRQDPAAEEALTLHAMGAVVLVSACFGVVLEGPMGAIPYWILLGLAHHAATRRPTAPLPAAGPGV
ncbi:MAG: O-antigen ligase family protein [Opitutaceae bacterium]|nr:O-antigen ligase family protein [Opitutaceae bacterium]